MFILPSSKWYFAKIGRLAPEEVIRKLLKCKCLAALCIACTLDKRTLRSLDFSFNRFFIRNQKYGNY